MLTHAIVNTLSLDDDLSLLGQACADFDHDDICHDLLSYSQLGLSYLFKNLIYDSRLKAT